MRTFRNFYKTKDKNKVRNARKVVLDNITFDSELEANCYKIFKQYFKNIKYEPEHIVYDEAFTIPIFKTYKCKKVKTCSFKNTAVRQAVYTPDFLIEHNGRKFYIEVKGFATSEWKLRFKKILKFFKNMPEYGN